MKSSKRHMTSGVELPNQVIDRMLGEKEPTNTWKYWKLTQLNNMWWKKRKLQIISE